MSFENLTCGHCRRMSKIRGKVSPCKKHKAGDGTYKKVMSESRRKAARTHYQKKKMHQPWMDTARKITVDTTVDQLDYILSEQEKEMQS